MAGCLNLHASILPRWRGAAPIQRAVMAGDAETGVDLMRMEAGLDTGPVALREAIPIRPEDTAGDLANRLAQIAAGLAVRGLSALERGSLEFREQSDAGVCYAKKISKTEAEIDWNRDADQVRNQIHGFSPNPGAYSLVSFGQRLERCKILRVQAVAANGAPGAILDGEMTVACARGAVRVIEGQRAGRAVMRGEDIIRGGKGVGWRSVQARWKLVICAPSAILSSSLLLSAARKICPARKKSNRPYCSTFGRISTSGGRRLIFCAVMAPCMICAAPSIESSGEGTRRDLERPPYVTSTAITMSARSNNRS